jgi:starch synthase (maltosyl-transferring)
MNEKGQSRIIIENIQPQIDAGRFPIKRVVNDTVKITVDLFGDGHDKVAGRLLYKKKNAFKWNEVMLTPTSNDQWEASFQVTEMGYYEYTVEGWIDHALNWHYEINKKAEAGQFIKTELNDGIPLLKAISEKSKDKKEKEEILKLIQLIGDDKQYDKALQLACSSRTNEWIIKYPLKTFSLQFPTTFYIWVDRKKAEYSTWYEFFPRSASPILGKHGTFKDCEKLLPRIAEMGFDTLYFPPIHPIGELNRKGKNNSVTAQPGEPGSPWAIGSSLGGHKDIHPELGTLKDFKSLINKAKDHGIEIAMDIALQCAPDHPYVKQYPQWFKWRSDGTVQYAENPPKKYQDILPIYFETEDWKNLWKELKSIFEYWIEQGIRVFRVDNPHTKPYIFWEYVIEEIHQQYPDVLFLSEAFTRPKVMHQLAKLGYTQSYTYYTWRNSKQEIIEYLTQLSTYPSKEYFRPNFWPNTPDINPYILQSGNESLLMVRYFMAATLSSNYGMYGPVYEYGIHEAVPGKEEYLNSEKYEIYHWDWTKNTRLKELIKMVNHARKNNSAFHKTDNIQFCDIENPNLLAYFKQSEDKSNAVLCVVSLDPYNRQIGWLKAPQQLGWQEGRTMLVHDLITGNSYYWQQLHNYIELNPFLPFHLFQIKLI